MAANRFKVEEGLEAYGNSVMQGNLTITDTLYLGAGFEFNTNTVSVPGSSNVTVDSYLASTYKFSKYVITIKNSTKVHTEEILVGTAGTNVFTTTYGRVWSDHALGTTTPVSNGANIDIVFTPAANSVPLTVSTYRILQG